MQPLVTNGQGRPSFAAMILSQTVHVLPSLELECGVTLERVPIAYKTWGTLNESRDNVMVICHAFTGSADVEDWWGPLMGPGKAFDPSRFFIFCGNVMGSPYGSASPITINPATGRPYGPEFPLTTIRDDVRAHKRILDHLGVRSIAVVVGGSMGGMAVLEWPLCTPPSYVQHIIPLATSARHSAWCISWSETQRQSIYSDPLFDSGYYSSSNPPKNGLSAARMAALLTYRSRDSFEGRFGRKPQIYIGPKKDSAGAKPALLTPPRSPTDKSLQALAAHNEGNRNKTDIPVIQTTTNSLPGNTTNRDDKRPTHGHGGGTTVFSAQSYLRYQGDKFTSRFDANCYIHITRKMDTHDVARGRGSSAAGAGDDDAYDDERGIYAHEGSNETLAEVLSTLPRGALVIGVESDGLFTPSEQRELAAHIPDAELVMIQSIDGHDGFLLEFQEINRHVLGFLHRVLPKLYTGEAKVLESKKEDFEVTRTSTFGEAEVDVAMW